MKNKNENENELENSLEELKRKIDYRQKQNKNNNILFNIFEESTSNSIAILGILMGSAGLIIFFFSSFLSNDETNINILIVDKIGKPIENAEVVFVDKNNPSINATDSQGFIKLKVSSKEELSVLIRKNGFKTILTNINTKDKSEVGKIYQLEIEKNNP